MLNETGTAPPETDAPGSCMRPQREFRPPVQKSALGAPRRRKWRQFANAAGGMICAIAALRSEVLTKGTGRARKRSERI